MMHLKESEVVLFIGSMLDMCKAEQLVSKQFEAPYVINLFTGIP